MTAREITQPRGRLIYRFDHGRALNVRWVKSPASEVHGRLRTRRWRRKAGLGFDDFFEPETEQLLRMLTVVTGSAQEAEDIVQDAGGGRPLLT